MYEHGQGLGLVAQPRTQVQAGQACTPIRQGRGPRRVFLPLPSTTTDGPPRDGVLRLATSPPGLFRRQNRRYGPEQASAAPPSCRMEMAIAWLHRLQRPSCLIGAGLRRCLVAVPTSQLARTKAGRPAPLGRTRRVFRPASAARLCNGPRCQHEFSDPRRALREVKGWSRSLRCPSEAGTLRVGCCRPADGLLHRATTLRSPSKSRSK